jgi:cytoskeletal protein CcmA (bactofilin family)
MFSKPDKPNAGAGGRQDARGARKSPRVASLLTDDLVIDGNLSGDADLHIDCTVRGDVSVRRLTIGETGRVEGVITAESAEIRGWVVGSITAQHIRLCGTARVDGDLTHESLTIEAGAQFEGRSHGFRTAPPILQVAAQT